MKDFLSSIISRMDKITKFLRKRKFLDEIE